MTMPAISLWQPWASLLVTRQPGDVRDIDPGAYPYSPLVGQMVKRFETRSWPCPPKYIGQRVAFHAAKRKPEIGQIGDWRLVDVDGDRWAMYRYGALGERTMLPLGAVVGSGIITASLPILDAYVQGAPTPDAVIVVSADKLWLDAAGRVHDISDQLPYGDWTPQRFAWAIADVVPLAEPIPCVGHQGFWKWSPT